MITSPSPLDLPPPLYAGFWIRGAAFLIDLILLNGIEFLVVYAISHSIGMDPFNEQVLDFFMSIGFYFYYYCIYQVKHQATFGKKWLGLQVVRSIDGLPITRKQAALRLFGYLLSFLMMGCGFLMVAFHPQKRAFHDLISRTMCIKVKK